MDTKTRLLQVARERLRNMPELAAQFERDLDALTGARLLAEAGAMPEVFRQAEALGNPKAGQAIRTHLAGVVDRWAKAQPLPAQLPPLELQATPAATKAPKLAADGPRAPQVHRLHGGRRSVLDPTIEPPAAPEQAGAKKWTPERLAELRAYRERHGTKKAAGWAGVSEARVRELLPSDKPQPKGYSAFTQRPK